MTPGYFRTLEVALIRGRLLTESDETDAAPVLLVNQAAAGRFFTDTDPIGQQIDLYGAPRTIVRMVDNERFHGLTEASPLAVYLPLTQAPSAAGVLLARTAGDPAALASAVRNAIREQDAALAVFGLEPLDEIVLRSVADRRFTMLVLSSFALLALLLAAIGIYGVLGYAVAERTREIGIRIALGATTDNVLRTVVGQGMTLAMAGVVVGLLGAWLLTRLLASLLFGVETTDAATFVLVPVVLAVVALRSSALPAYRATRIDPVAALRAE